jgi:plastocyanin
MRFALASSTLATLVTAVLAANIQVQVGGPNGLNYNPQSVTAAQGDTIEFVFMPKNHTVTQSTFAAPCQPMSNGIDSGFMPVPANSTQVPSMTVLVNDTNPLWFFCKQVTYDTLFSPFVFSFGSPVSL